MKTVVNNLSDTLGLVLFSIKDDEQIDLKPGEQIIDAQCDLPYDPETQVQVWNFESQTFSVQSK